MFPLVNFSEVDAGDCWWMEIIYHATWQGPSSCQWMIPGCLFEMF